MGQTKDRGTIKGLKVVLILPIIFICIAFLLNLLYSLPIKDSLLWYVGVFLCFYIPGSLLLRYLDFNKDEYFINFFHSIALGAALIPLVYIIFRRLSHPEMVYPFGIAIFLAWLILTVRDFKRGQISVDTSFLDIQSALVLIAVVFLLLHLSYFTDVIFLENGFKFRNTYLNETCFHLGIINVLRNIFPPLYPYASGVNFSHYHLNMHLEIEMFNRLFSIDTLKLTFFYFPLFYFCLLVFVPFIFIRKYLGTRFVGVLTGILMFGSDLSFIPGLLGMFPTDIPWNILFNSTVWPLLTLNGNLPALFVMFLCILYLTKFYENGNLLYLIVFVFLGFSAYGFKSSMGPHIMGASFLTGIASMILMKDIKKGKLVCAMSAFTILAMVIDTALFREGAGNNIVSIAFFNRFHDSLKYLGISDMSKFFYPMILPIYILAAFGIRALGVYSLKDVFKKKYFDSKIVYLTIFVISGFIFSDIIFIGPDVPPPFKINNAMWFSLQSLMGAWLLLSCFLLKISHLRKRFLGVVFLIILLSTPSTIQFLLLRFNKSYYTVDSNSIEIVKYLDTTPPKSVILHPPNLEGPSLSSNLSGRLSVLSFYQSYVIQTIGQKESVNRLKDLELFFSPNEAVNRSSILIKYKVDYVYVPLSYATIFNREHMLSQVLKNSGYVLYRVDMSNNSP